MVCFASRKKRLKTVTMKKPTTAHTTAHVGVFCVVIHWSCTSQREPRSAKSPTGVKTLVDVTRMSPIWAIVGAVGSAGNEMGAPGSGTVGAGDDSPLEYGPAG